jgi:hypothetical protein
VAADEHRERGLVAAVDEPPEQLRVGLVLARDGPQGPSRTHRHVGAGDAVELVSRSEEELTVADVVRLFTTEAGNQDLLRRAMRSPVLPLSWKDYFGEMTR